MKQYEPIPDRAERAAKAVVESAYRVHSSLGPGLLESVYEVCLCQELRKQDVAFQSQLVLPVVYDGVTLDAGFRLDVLVDDSMIFEIKVAEKMLPVYEAQLLTYLKLAGKAAERNKGITLRSNFKRTKDNVG